MHKKSKTLDAVDAGRQQQHTPINHCHAGCRNSQSLLFRLIVLSPVPSICRLGTLLLGRSHRFGRS